MSATPLDYASLRQAALSHLERLGGSTWTDFNTHDPGITLLEQLCYALSDLGYRLGHRMPDLLASSGASSYDGLFAPSTILSCHPITLRDLRRRLLDVDGVKNAWIELAHGGDVPLHYHPGRGELSQEEELPASEPVELRGLYHVLVEPSDVADVDGSVLRARVAQAAHASRNLCEDFADIRVLRPQKIRVQASVEIGAVDDAEELLVRLYQQLSEQISPRLPFVSLEERLASGAPLDEVFNGPLLAKGFLDDDALDAAERRTRVNVSDLIHALMDVPGVRAVRHVAVADATAAWEDWSLVLDSTRAPKLDVELSTLTVQRDGIPVELDRGAAIAAYWASVSAAESVPRGARAALLPAEGRDRQVGRYHSVQLQFPDLYGVNELGLARSAPAARQGRRRQLQAYLLLFDQILASTFTQLAHLRDLFTFDTEELGTRFIRAVDDEGLGLDDVRASHGEEHQARLEGMLDPSLEQRHRLLGHLAARFAESFTDYSLMLKGAVPGDTTAEEKLARDLQAFLRDYPRISNQRGTAFDALRTFGGENVSGLEHRLRLKLGLHEDFLLVEHILLRPLPGDTGQSEPILAAVASRDPYSLQLSVAFPDEDRLRQPGFRRFIEQTVRQETPAHLAVDVRWLDRASFDALRDAYAAWLEDRRAYWTEKLSLSP